MARERLQRKVALKLSPRERRLHSDFRGMQELAAESSILTFECSGDPPQQYRIVFEGRGVRRAEDGQIQYAERHEVLVKLTAAYPRMMPELAWLTPVFHPNISASGVVCLGGYGTHWVPSLRLDEMCHMLWDMIRYRNLDVESPYNREAAAWARMPENTEGTFPVDRRPLRDRVAVGQVLPGHINGEANTAASTGDFEGVEFVEAAVVESDIVEAEVVEVEPIDAETLPSQTQRQSQSTNDGDSDILFID